MTAHTKKHLRPIDRNHPAIRAIRRLRLRDEREKTGLFYVEGLRFVHQAVQNQACIKLLVVCPPLLEQPYTQRLVEQLRRNGTPALEVSPEVMQHITLMNEVQGIGAIVQQRWEALEELQARDDLCWIMPVAVRLAGNLGTIVRTSDAVGGAGIIILAQSPKTTDHKKRESLMPLSMLPESGNATRALPNTASDFAAGKDVDPYDPATVRATMGAIFTQRFIRTTLADFIRWKKQSGSMLVGTSPTASIDYHAVQYRLPTILMMGEERKGLPPDLQALCDLMVSIPMVGQSDSLNLGVATSILLYELFNQQRSRASV